MNRADILNVIGNFGYTTFDQSSEIADALIAFTAPPAAVQPDDRDARIRGLEVALAQELEIPEPDSGRDAALEIIARAIWNVRREEEDRCDMDLEDMGEDHPVWTEARAVSAAMAAQQSGQAPAAKDQT